VDKYDPWVVVCLLDYYKYITTPACKQRVLRYMALFPERPPVNNWCHSCSQKQLSEGGKCQEGGPRLIKTLPRRYMRLSAQDIRVNVDLDNNCHDDRQKYCSNVAPVSAPASTHPTSPTPSMRCLPLDPAHNALVSCGGSSRSQHRTITYSSPRSLVV
jgi:hypothetical protein